MRLISLLPCGLLLSLSVTQAAQAAPYCAPSGPAAPVLSQHVARGSTQDPVLNLGPLAETLAGELRAQLCADAAVAQTLLQSCAADAGGNLQTLRARLIADVLNAPAAALSNQLTSLPAEQRVAVGFLAALSGGVEPGEVAHRTAQRLGYVAEECLPPAVNAADPVGLALSVVWRLSQNAPEAVLRSQEQALSLTTETLLQARGGVPLSAVETALATQVAQQSLATFAWWQKWQQSSGDDEALTQLLLAEFTLLQRALSLTHAREVTLPTEAWATLSAVLHRNLDGAVAMLKQWLESRGQLQSAVLDAATTLLRFSRAATREEAERIVRGQVVGLGPWSEKVLFSASGGVPQLQSNNFNIVGEGLLGYNDEAWGIVGGGGATVIEFESDEYFASTAKLFGNGDAWFNLNLGERTKLDFRGTFDVSVFDSDTTVATPGAPTLNGSETSMLLRGGGLVGLRYQQPYLGLGAWAGGGAQLDSHDQRGTVATGNDVSTELDDSDSVSGAAQARARVQWEFLPAVLALRASLDWRLYSMARLTSAIDANNTDVVLVETDESATQLEAIGRAFIDLEVARVFDFVPGVGIGVDHYELAVSGQPTQLTTIPIYMLGVRRSVF
jgi:hypothetical protein